MLIDLIIGLVLGFLAGLGVGGGSLLILWLTLLAGVSQSDARWINLLFFITAAGAVSIFRWKKGALNLRTLWPAMIGGCIAAALFTMLRSIVNPELLKKAFGILLLFTGIRELLYRPRKAR